MTSLAAVSTLSLSHEVTTSHQMPCPEPSALPQLRTHFTSFTSPSVIWGSLNHLVSTKNLPSFLEEIRKPGEGSPYRGHPDLDRLTVDKYGYIVPLFTCFTRRNVRVCPLRSRAYFMSRELRVYLTKGVTTSRKPVRTKKEMVREMK